MNARNLTQMQRFALLALGRIDRFRWELDLMTEERMFELAAVDLAMKQDGRWLVTAAGKELIAKLSVQIPH